MQKIVQNLAQVSLYFFVFFGALHIGTSLLMANGAINRADTLIFNVLDLPFLLAALVYGSARFSLALEPIVGDLKKSFITCGSFAFLFFLTALYFNFGLSDANF
ncbi:MAG: hypothetical protein WC777_04745 [Candidatus Gracilibacteria bacterium]